MPSHCLDAELESLSGQLPSAWSFQGGALCVLASLSLTHSLLTHSFIDIDISFVPGTVGGGTGTQMISKTIHCPMSLEWG